MPVTHFIRNTFVDLQSETLFINELLHSSFSRIFRLFRNNCFKEIDGLFKDY